ncbi:MAG: hypothetical protein E4G98_06530 [Promethearchaeota archaeon]|nr:MAG: hypothetical protein E4G98_06530 [Candidatus Lokiarchaeota archaeon]
MARTGKKTIAIQIVSTEDLEEIIEYANKRADAAGIRLTVDYTHDVGLKLIIAGPKDKINLFEHQIRDFLHGEEETSA